MKKVILSLILMLSSFFVVNAQSYYTATTTEMYTYDNENEKWTLYQKNSDVNITIVLEDEFVSIQAKTPTIFKIYKENAQDISNKKFTGYRYDALDLKKNLKCVIDVVKFGDDSYMVSVFSNNKDYNLRYYIKTQ